MEIEIAGVEVFGRHGVLEVEHERPQAFLFDVWLQVAEPRADDIAATVDYREVLRIVEAVSDSQHYELIESLAIATAERLRADLAVDGVRVRVRKPGVDWALYTAATAER